MSRLVISRPARLMTETTGFFVEMDVVAILFIGQYTSLQVNDWEELAPDQFAVSAWDAAKTSSLIQVVQHFLEES